MADISSYLTAIETAIKGKEVRGSIHDAIEAINNENISLHSEVIAEVSETMDEVIDILWPIYTFNFSTESCTCDTEYNDILAALNSGKTIMPILKAAQGYDYRVFSGVITYVTGEQFISEFNIPNVTGSGGITITHIEVFHDDYDTVSANKVTGSGSGGGGGSTYTAGTGIDITNYVISALDQSFTLPFTIDNNGDIHVSKSSTDAETFMNSKYGLNNWSWLDFWKEAKIILIDEYNDHHSSSNPNILMCTHLEASDSGDVDIYFTESIIDDYNIPGGISRTVHFTWIYNTSWDTEDSISHGNYYDYKKVITAGTGISISESTSIQYGTSDIEISLDLQNAEDNSF